MQFLTVSRLHSFLTCGDTKWGSTTPVAKTSNICANSFLLSVGLPFDFLLSFLSHYRSMWQFSNQYEHVYRIPPHGNRVRNDSSSSTFCPSTHRDYGIFIMCNKSLTTVCFRKVVSIGIFMSMRTLNFVLAPAVQMKIFTLLLTPEMLHQKH